MKNIILLMVTALLFAGCTSTFVRSQDNPINRDAPKFTLTGINDTDSPMKWAQTWALTVWRLRNQQRRELPSLCRLMKPAPDVITITPGPPKKIQQSNPSKWNVPNRLMVGMATLDAFMLIISKTMATPPKVLSLSKRTGFT